MTGHSFWPDIIRIVRKELALYDARNIWPSLRKMYYNLVSKQILPNTKSMYNSLSQQTARARERRVLPIDCFYDEYSIIKVDDKYLSPMEVIDEHLKKLQNLFEDYKPLPRWYNQSYYVEIWTEKNAMVPDFKNIVDEAGLEVRIIPHGGYVSLSQLNDSINRICEFIKLGKKHIRILYFGDFDPSGEQMFEDIENRLAIVWGFENGNAAIKMGGKRYEFSFDLERIAVNKHQVDEYDLPKDPQSVKDVERIENDTRTPRFIATHGRIYATELDSLPEYELDIFTDMVVNGVNQYFDQDIYDHELEVHKEEHSPDTITKLVKQRTEKFLMDSYPDSEGTGP